MSEQRWFGVSTGDGKLVMTIEDMEQSLLSGYRDLHDGLSEMIESGRLTQADIPDDYEWLIETLADLSTASDKLDRALEEEGG